MVNLTFGEQVKVILSRKGMTIKELAERVEAHTGKPMSRQNMTQRLSRDNFQEQDMRLIAEILGCEFTLSIMEPVGETVSEPVSEPMTEPEQVSEESTQKVKEEVSEAERELLRKGVKGFFGKVTADESVTEAQLGDINPYTRKEYESNSVRMHPKQIGYVQVYDRDLHRWTDMTEWAFLGYQERKKKLLGKDYKPPIYLD